MPIVPNKAAIFSTLSIKEIRKATKRETTEMTKLAVRILNIEAERFDMPLI
jgi:hypothetical protein